MNSDHSFSSKLSWWERNHFLEEVDITVLGAGIVGISTAIELKLFAPELKVLILDRKTIPIGASTKNAGFACFGSVSEILDDIDSFGVDICKKLLAMRSRGLSILKGRVSRSEMNYLDEEGIEIFDSEKESYYLEKIHFVNEIINDVLGERECFRTRNGQYGIEIVNRLEGSLNPQLMMDHLELLARNMGVRFMQGVEVQNIKFEHKVLNTNVGQFSYNKLVICTNGFTPNFLSLKGVQPARNQVLITSKVEGFSLDGCYHMNKGYVYFREIDGRLLLGGGRHINKDRETTDSLENTKEIIDYLRGIAERKILKGKRFEIEHIWSGILGVGKDKIPILDQVNENTLIAVKMGGMGVAIGSYIGRVAASILLNLSNSDRDLFVSS